MKKVMVILVMVVLFSFNCSSIFAAGSRTKTILDDLCIDCPKMENVFDHTFTAYEMRSIAGFIYPRDSKNLLALRHLITGEGLSSDEIDRITAWLNEDESFDSMEAFDKIITIVSVNYKRIFMGDENPFIVYNLIDGEQGSLNNFPIGVAYLNYLCRYFDTCHISGIIVKCGKNINEDEYDILIKERSKWIRFWRIDL